MKSRLGEYLQLESGFILKSAIVVFVSSMRRNLITLSILDQLGFSWNLVIECLVYVNQDQWVQEFCLMVYTEFL